MAAQPGRKRDRDEVFLEYPKSVCPGVKAVVDAQVNIRDGKVYLRKRCRSQTQDCPGTRPHVNVSAHTVPPNGSP